MRAADSLVVLRAIVRDDAVQARAADEHARPGAWVSHLVLAEVVWTLASTYGHGHEDIEDAVEMLLEHDSFVLEDPHVVSAALDSFRRSRRVGFVDCLILETARRAGHLPLGTFDRDMAKLDGAERL